MKITAYYKKCIPKRELKYNCDKSSKGRPAWVEVKGLPKNTNFIKIHLGKKGKEGARIQFYRTYLTEGLFLPLDYTSEEIAKFYDKWAKNYDVYIEKGGKGIKGQNIQASLFLLSKLKKIIKQGSLLDLGAGTGLITEIFVENGYKPATLVDFSEGMLSIAKKRKLLKGSEFIQEDIRKLNLNKKFDLIISFFSFGSSSYFKREELKQILKVAGNHLKPNGIFAILGHISLNEFKDYFDEVDSGIYDLSTKNKFFTDYFIGRKR